MSADLTFFPPEYLKPEAKALVLSWVASWPLPIEAKKQSLSLWANTYGVQLSRADWQQAIPEEK